MKILVVSNMYPDSQHPYYGTFVKKFCKQLAELNISYDKVILNKKNNRINKFCGYIMFYLTTFYYYLFKDYDVFYVHYPSFSGVGIVLASIFKKKNIYVNVHGSDVFPEKYIHKKMLIFTKILLNNSDKVIVPSEYFKKNVNKSFNIDESKIFIYPSGGIDSEVFKKKHVIGQKKQLEDKRTVIGLVGRITKDKGWDTFLEAVSQLKLENYKIVVVGDGNEFSKFINLSKELNIFDNLVVKNLLSQEELGNLYNTLDILIFPSKREGESLGLVPIEALCCGVPVISSDIEITKEYVIDNFNGMFFEKNNPESLLMKINEYTSLSSGEKRIMSESASEIGSKYYESNILNSLEKIMIEEENKYYG